MFVDRQAQMDAANPSSASSDPLAALLSNLENGLSDDPNLQEALDSMMSQLMSKELLYEPIKDLNEKVCLSPSIPPLPRLMTGGSTRNT